MATLTSKPLAWFKVAAQVRQHFDEAELRLLGESLKVKQLQPVLARSDGTLIAGERRFRAASLVGLKELEVVINEEPLTESQVRIFQLTENIHRADLTDAEKWRSVRLEDSLMPSLPRANVEASLGVGGRYKLDLPCPRSPLVGDRHGRVEHVRQGSSSRRSPANVSRLHDQTHSGQSWV